MIKPNAPLLKTSASDMNFAKTELLKSAFLVAEDRTGPFLCNTNYIYSISSVEYLYHFELEKTAAKQANF